MHDPLYWSFAAISIVLVSWILFRYLTPRSWREWTGAGVVQAFLIAFYAEMYGFPVTLYALMRVFGLDGEGPLWRGNLWAYLTGSENVMFLSMIAGYAIAIFGVLLLVLAWRQIHRGVREGRSTLSIVALRRCSFPARPPGVPWPGPSHLGRINLLQPRRPPHGLNLPAACNRRAGPCGVLHGSHADDASPSKRQDAHRSDRQERSALQPLTRQGGAWREPIV